MMILESNNSLNLILDDMDNFFNKYMRFLSKDIYIDYNTYTYFILQYKYLFCELDKFKYLYYKNDTYQKVMKIREESFSLLKLHNLKYLKDNKDKYLGFFDNGLGMDNINIIISNEKRLVYLNNKDNILFIITKLKYMRDILRENTNNIIILTKKYEEYSLLKDALIENNLKEIKCYYLKDYQKKFLKDKELKITYNMKYDFFKSYLLEHLFLDKEKFTKFYQAFKNYLYLNKDYKDFDTFKDYHSYMYKRMFLESNLSLNKFIKREILKRKRNNRSILNEEMLSKELVDIANFLYLNSISYIYNKDKFIFYLDNNIQINYNNSTLISNNKNIILESSFNSKGKTLEVLTYELIKRRIGMERRGEEEVYNTLRETSIDLYITEFISLVLIPLTTSDLNNTKFMGEQKMLLQSILDIYNKYLRDNYLVEEVTLNERISKYLDNYYKILLNINNIEVRDNYLVILEDYQENTLLKNNIKLALEYKKYLNYNKYLLFKNTYISLSEKDKLTNEFLKENIKEINNSISKDKAIRVVFYKDDNRFLIRENLALTLNDILRDMNSKSTLIALSSKNEINDLTKNTIFSKDNNNITNGENTYFCDSIYNIDKSYKIIVLPYLIKSRVEEDLFRGDNTYRNKLLLFNSVNKARDNIYILVPDSSRGEIKQYLKAFTNVVYE